MEKKRKKSNSSLPKTTLPSRVPVPYVPSDPLEHYIELIKRHPILPGDEQIELAKKFKETGDVQILKQLVTSNLRLVVKIAMEYRNSYQNTLDLIQEGNVGLLKAVSNYDPYKGTRLSYYASWWIRSYILKFLLDNFRLVKVGTTQAQRKLFYNLMREKNRLEAKGLAPSPKLLASKLEVKESDLVEMETRLSDAGRELSIDQDIREGSTLHDFMESPDKPVDERLAHKQLQEVLRDQVDTFLSTLNEKERAVFQDRLMSESPKTLQEIAFEFGFSRERARQIEAKVLEKLRKQLGPSIGKPFKKAPKQSKKKKGE